MFSRWKISNWLQTRTTVSMSLCLESVWYLKFRQARNMPNLLFSAMLHWNCKLPQVVEIMKISKWAPNAYWTAYCAKCDCCKSHWRLSLKKSQQLNGGHCIFVLRVWTLNPNMSIVCTLYMTWPPVSCWLCWKPGGVTEAASPWPCDNSGKTFLS